MQLARSCRYFIFVFFLFPFYINTIPFAALQRGTTHIVWSKGRGPLSSLNGLNVLTDTITAGMSRTELLRMVAHETPKFPRDTWKFKLVADQVRVPDAETTYWCRVQRLPQALQRKYALN